MDNTWLRNILKDMIEPPKTVESLDRRLSLLALAVLLLGIALLFK